jgi:hypothetical protein
MTALKDEFLSGKPPFFKAHFEFFPALRAGFQEEQHHGRGRTFCQAAISL